MKNALKATSLVRVNPETIYKIYKSKVYILEPEKGVLRTLNASASFIWQFLLKQRVLRVVIDEVQKEFQISNGMAGKDVRNFIDLYIKKGFIVVLRG